MKLIRREKYISKIHPFIRKDIIKVLIGSRRVGKTYILYQLIEEIKKNDAKANIIYISKEEYEFKSITNDEQLFQFVIQHSFPEKNNYLFIDEVQEIEKFELALRQLLLKKYDIYCTGSNARMLSSDLATHLSGRYIEIPVFSLSYYEFLEFHKLENNKNTLLKYIKYGGLPYLINLSLQDEIIYGYLKNIYNTIILKDIVSRYSIRDVDFLDRLTEYISDSLGSLVSSKKITEFLKSQRISLSINTVLNYLTYLSNSYFIDKVQRYDIQGKKIFEINDKYYFRDLGLKHSIIPYKPNDINKVLENMVYNKLLCDGYKVNVGKFGDKEIDFVAKRNGEVLYVQVAYLLSDEKVFEREFGKLLGINDNYRKIVVSADDYAQGNYKGIEHENILVFLNKSLMV
jgi:uncharacterized protein